MMDTFDRDGIPISMERFRQTSTGAEGDLMDAKLHEIGEKHERFLFNTGGNPVGELLEGNANVFSNAPLALIQCSVRDQVRLLARLKDAGLLREEAKVVDG